MKQQLTTKNLADTRTHTHTTMTFEELKRRQSLTLEQKIDHAVGAIEAFRARTGLHIYVSFSGGKDSTVLLDICRRFVDRDCEAVFDNTGNEYPEIVDFVRSVENVTFISPRLSVRGVIAKYGFPLISKETAQLLREARTTSSAQLLDKRLHGVIGRNGRVSGKVPDKWQYLLNRPFAVSEQCCSVLKKRPFAAFNRQTGKAPIIGTMASESALRMQAYLRRGGCNSFDANHLASYPLSIWTEADIWAYIRKFNVPICSLYRRFNCLRTGCMFCGFGAHLETRSRFSMLYELHPQIYRAVLRYENNGVTYREALRSVGVSLPDENPELPFAF